MERIGAMSTMEIARRGTKIHTGIQTGADRAPTKKSSNVPISTHLLSKIPKLTPHASSPGRSTVTQLSFLPCP